MPTTISCGIELPILKDLGEGFFLAAHKGGPVICTESTLSTLEFCGYEPDFTVDGEEDPLTLTELKSLYPFDIDKAEFDDGGIPFRIRVNAIRAYVELSWPLKPA